MQSLLNQFESLKSGNIIKFKDSNIEYTLIENRIGDHLFFKNRFDSTKMFHLFYDEISQETDTFTIIGNNYE